MAKNPWIAAVLNFFLLGPGYIYNGKRVPVGIALTVAALIGTFVELSLQMDGSSLFLFSFVSFFILGSTCAYDGYQEALAI
ncbi:MAG: hypothetical protein ACE5OZ_08495 [Candidatus Heimdallarchaeota archaeon]